MNSDALVRRADEDRWLASRFAPPDIRAKLVAIYALNGEIARTSELVREPAMGAIRLAWWRDAIADVHAGNPPAAHEALKAYAPFAAELPGEPWARLIEARALDFEPAPFESWSRAERYVEDTAGVVLRLAVAACGGDAEAHAPFLRSAAWTWGYLGLARAAPVWSARGRTLPPTGELHARAKAAFTEARQRARALPARLFPACGYLALAPFYLRSAMPALFARQLRLVWASATGRL